MLSSFSKLTLWFAASIILGLSCVFGQSSGGRLTGKVVDKDGKPVAGVVVHATNQTSTEVASQKTRSDGSYSIRLRSGAYRITVAAPFEARFDRGKTVQYGIFSNIICDKTRKSCATLENVIIDSGERKIDFVVVEPEKESAAKPGDADKTNTVPTGGPDRREVRDRWRYEFPEYDRYGDNGARGRDVPFRQGRWYNP